MKKIDFILDTDAGSDCDDVMALAYLIYAKRHLSVNLKAITYCHTSKYGAAAIRGIFRSFGEAAPEIGVMTGGKETTDYYCRQIAERFAEKEDFSPADEAVKVLRKALSESEECVICAIGPLTNIRGLMESGADGISPLSGTDLLREKCSKIVLMAGAFTGDEMSRKPEWNVLCDIRSAKRVTELSPVPLMFVPYETGVNMITGKPAVEKYGDKNPLPYSFMLFPGAENGRHSWDPAAAVYSVEGICSFFEQSIGGAVTVDDNGRTFISDGGKKNHFVINIGKTADITEQEMKDRAAAYIDSCALEVLKN